MSVREEVQGRIEKELRAGDVAAGGGGRSNQNHY